MIPRCYSDTETVIDTMIDGRNPLNSGGFRHAGKKAQDRETRLTFWERGGSFLVSDNDVDRETPAF
jgi:hypothetical protein